MHVISLYITHDQYKLSITSPLYRVCTYNGKLSDEPGNKSGYSYIFMNMNHLSNVRTTKSGDASFAIAFSGVICLSI